MKKNLTKEHREKIGIANRGKKRPDLALRNSLSRIWLGKKHKEETKKKISDANKREKHYAWKGGVTKENELIRHSREYKNWRKSVFQRDNYKCCSCGKKGGYLEAHHVKSFALHKHLRFIVDNGKTLCKKCHKVTDNYGFSTSKHRGKKALIFGLTGQDGSYLAEFLLDLGYNVSGVIRRTSSLNTERIDHLKDKIDKHYGDVMDAFSVINIIKKVKPDEIYQLAAQSHVQVSWENPWLTAQITGVGMLNVLEAVRVLDMEKKVKIYNASTSEMFSGLEGCKQNENTPKDPVSPYGTAKLYAYQLCKNYRQAFGMFISSGILFNHESPRRGYNFVTKKIVNEMYNGEVRLGNTESSRDWGFSPEYCEAMWLMLQKDKPDDYVIATGETHTVKEFVGWVEKYSGHKLKIIHDKGYDRPKDVPLLSGDGSKAERELGWKPIVKGEQVAKIMVQYAKKNL